jgi:hypothetical protein
MLRGTRSVTLSMGYRYDSERMCVVASCDARTAPQIWLMFSWVHRRVMRHYAPTISRSNLPLRKQSSTNPVDITMQVLLIMNDIASVKNARVSIGTGSGAYSMSQG